MCEEREKQRETSRGKRERERERNREIERASEKVCVGGELKDRERREEWQRESWCAEKCVGRVWRGDNSGEVRVPHVEVRVVRVLQYDCGSGREQIHTCERGVV